MSFDDEAAAVVEALPPGRRVVVIGSTSFHGDDSDECCRCIARAIADLPQIVAITGGMLGVGATFAVAFEAAYRKRGDIEQLYHLLPRGSLACRTGVTLFAGDDLHQRREILGRIGDVYIAIEGGPGTVHEAEVAQARGASLIPVGRTGGYSTRLHEALTVNMQSLAANGKWHMLASRAVPLTAVANAARDLVAQSLGGASS